MRIGMRLLLGYFLLVAVAAWFVLAIFVKEVKPGVRRATEDVNRHRNVAGGAGASRFALWGPNAWATGAGV